MTIDLLPDMHDELPEPGFEPARTSRRSVLAVAVLAAIVLAGGFTIQRGRAHDKVDVRSGTTLVDEAGMAARYGINITLVGVSAAGGLIDFRYQVVDPDKASQLLHDTSLYPKFIVEDTGELVAVNSLPHNHGTELQLGATYFFLLANAHNAIHKGSALTVVIGDARLEHLRAEG